MHQPQFNVAAGKRGANFSYIIYCWVDASLTMHHVSLVDF